MSSSAKNFWLLLSCVVSLSVDLGACLFVTHVAHLREDASAPCQGSPYVCSFADLLLAFAARVSALLCALLIGFIGTRSMRWCHGLRQSQQQGTQSFEAEQSREPLLSTERNVEGGTLQFGNNEPLESEAELMASLEAERAAQRFKQGIKTASVALIYAITVTSQVYVALKVGLFKNHGMFEPSSLLWGVADPLAVGLVMTVLGVNLEAIAFSAAAESIWRPQQYSCPSLHIHPLEFDPSKVAFSCKSCGKGLNQGFRVAFNCKKCNYVCCIACYRKKKAEGHQHVEGDEGHTQQASAGQETEVGALKLVALAVRMTASEAPLLLLAMTSVLASTLLDNLIPDVQGRIFSDLVNNGVAGLFSAGAISTAGNSTADDDQSFFGFDGQHPLLLRFRDHLLTYVYFQLSSMILGLIKSRTFQIFALRITSKLQKQLFGKILSQEMEFFDDASVGDLSSRLSNETPGMLAPINQIVPSLISSAGGLVIGMYFCFKYSWKLSLCCFATIPPIIHVSRVYAKWSSQLWQQRFVGYGAANNICNEAFSNIRTVHSFSTESHEEGKYVVEMDQMVRYGLIGSIGTSVSGLVNGVLGLSTNMLVLGYGGYLVLLNALGIAPTGFDAGKLIAYQLYMNKMQGAFKSIQNQINSVTKATGAAQRVMGLIESMPDEDGKPAIPEITNGTVEYEDVRFSYRSRPDMEVLKGLSLVVPGGSVCGVVGTSGAGKSTVLSLLMQFYRPSSGRLLLDGNDLAKFDRRTTHRYMGIVTQETQLFANTIEENIAYGLEGYTSGDLEEAARKAHALGFIQSFPDGFATRVGERGVMLSGGQRQRLALARLLIRNPKVVLLDEATSALDAESEAAVQEALDELIASGGRTIIVVAHRLSTVKDADSIAVMDKGRVAELGPHEELVKSSGGIYSNLVRRQLEGLSSSMSDM